MSLNGQSKMTDNFRQKNGHIKMGSLVKSYLAMLAEAEAVKKEFYTQTLISIQQLIPQSMPEQLSSLEKVVNELLPLNKKACTDLSVFGSDAQSLKDTTNQLLSTVNVIDQYVQKNCNLTERGIRNAEKMSNEVVDRESEQLCIGFLGIISNLDEKNRKWFFDDFQRIILDQRQMELICPGNNEKFDPKRHQPIETVQPDDPAYNNRVAKCHKAGLFHRSRVVAPAQVAIYKL